MTKKTFSFFAALALVSTMTFTGCSNTGPAPEPETTALTEEEIQEMADYEAEQEKNAQRMREQGN